MDGATIAKNAINIANNVPTFYQQNAPGVFTNEGDAIGLDCSDFVASVYWGWDGTGSPYDAPNYGNTGLAVDYTESLLAMFTTFSDDFTNIPIGAVMYKPGHVGIYVGEGQVAESLTSPNGVSVVGINSHVDGPWTGWGLMPEVGYSDLTEEQRKELAEAMSKPRPDSSIAPRSNPNLTYGGSSPTGVVGRISDGSYETIDKLSSQPFHAFVNLYIGGEQIPNIPPQYLLELSMTMLSGTDLSIADGTITLFDRYCNELEHMFIQHPDDVVIEFGHVTGIRSQRMYFVAESYNIHFHPAGNTLTVNLKGPGFSKINPKFSKSFGSNGSEAIAAAATEAGMQIGTIEESLPVMGQGGKPSTFTAINENLKEFTGGTLEYLKSAKDGSSGLVAYEDNTVPGGRLNVVSPFSGSELSRTYVYMKGKNSPIVSFSLTTNIKLGGTAASTYTASGLNPYTKESFTENYARSANMVTSDSHYTLINDSDNPHSFDTTGLSQEEVAIRTSYRFTNSATLGDDAVQGVLTIIGDPTVRPFERIRLIIINEDFTMHNLSGIYQTTNVNHTISGGILLTNISIFKMGNVDGSVLLSSARVID